MVARWQGALYDVTWCADALLHRPFATICEVGEMSFFLLGKDSDGRLTLLSETALPTRQAAMAELSRVTGDPAFSSWDDEVVVMDLDAGTPVLLVRPAAGSGAAEEPAGDADEVAVESAEPEEPAETASEEQAEPDAEEYATAEAEPADDDGAPEESELAEDASVVEAPALDAEPAVSVEDEDEISLKEALQRTAEQMESEGISAPESVGPADADEAEPTADEEPLAAEDSGETAAKAGDAEESAEETQSWPWDTAPAAETPAEEDAEAAPFALDALEEPGTDDAGLVRAPGDDETMSSSRPVILGAYGETDIETEPAAASMEVTVEAEQVPAPEIPADVVATPDADSEMSDFILDLEPTPPGYELSSSAQTQMSCLDCIYERTCPHKDVGPPDCGSFQWK
jgi:hypothetical protein